MKYSENRPPHLFVSVFLFTLLAFVPALHGQTENANVAEEKSAGTAAVSSPVAAPALSELKGVKIGMSAEEAIKELGKPETSDAAGMYFELSKGEAMHVALDDARKVTTLSMMYTGKGSDAPEFAEVFGSGVQPDKQENGSLFKRVRYNDQGIWVAYSRLGDKDNPMITVTIQKIPR